MLNASHIVPSLFDPRFAPMIAPAVAEAIVTTAAARS
jgi:hypothetical protein